MKANITLVTIDEKVIASYSSEIHPQIGDVIVPNKGTWVRVESRIISVENKNTIICRVRND